MNIFKFLLLILFAMPSTFLSAAEVRVAFGEKIPPFCFPATDSGIEVEVIGEALAFRGHVLKPEYYPFARIPVAFLAHNVDAAMTDLGRNMESEGGLYGDPAVFYDNVFITLKERNITINKPEDLQGLSVIAFSGAAKRYPEWLQHVQDSNLYYEQNNQALQALTLDRQHYDVVLSDRNIFKYFTLHLRREKGFDPKPVEEQHFVELNPMDYRPVFWDEHIRDDFNAGLKHLKETGRYQEIYDKYLK